ncbi:GyrI-like domain-containing protein [Neobacillus sp. D3-1R]|uniref:GyrI-like domain-containing protein n=1 Tax=Neobacillus sp. D3-1R TaxID=3445778 RepID=UPI003F9F3CC6
MQIVKKEAFNVVGKKVIAHWQELGVEMPKAWKEVIERKAEVKNRISPNILDICLQLVNEEFTQLVCVEVSDLSEIPEGFEGVHIPEQQYLYTKHTGSVMEIAQTFGAMIQWAKDNHLTIDPLDFKIQYTHENNPEEGYDLYFKII